MAPSPATSAATSTSDVEWAAGIGAMVRGTETCYLGAADHGADPQGPFLQFVMKRAYM